MNEKRKRDEGSSKTEDIIQAALREQQEAKKAKKQVGPDVNEAADKGKTLGDIEQEEGGTIKESEVAMAHAKRTQKRKARKGTREDTELVGDDALEEVEEALELEEDDGIKLEPFNLAQERQEGFFDDEGHYVEKRDKEEEEAEKDAWFSSTKDDLVSDRVRQQLEARERALQESEEAPAMTAPQVADYKRQLAALMQPGESITEALRRLRPPPARGPSAKAPKKGKKGSEAEKGTAKPQKTPEEVKALEDFNKITEAASALMDAGEMDIYSAVREELQRAADAFKDDDDMFADMDEDNAKGASTSAAGAGPAASLAPASGAATEARAAPSQTGPQQVLNGSSSAAAAPSAAAREAEGVDYSTWPVKELRRFLTERGINASGIVEKADLVAQVKAAAESGPEGEIGAAPAGFVLDPSSGYYYSAETGMYYDAASGGYFSSIDSKWYSYDPQSNQYVEYQNSSG